MVLPEQVQWVDPAAPLARRVEAALRVLAGYRMEEARLARRRTAETRPVAAGRVEEARLEPEAPRVKEVRRVAQATRVPQAALDLGRIPARMGKVSRAKTAGMTTTRTAATR